MSQESNMFEWAAAVARSRREAKPPASADRQQWAGREMATRQKMVLAWQGVYARMSEEEAVRRGLDVGEYFSEGSQRIAREFLDFTETRGCVGSEHLEAPEAGWRGRGYPIPYSRQAAYLCTDGNVRGSDSGGVVLARLAIPLPVDLERPQVFRTEDRGRWIRREIDYHYVGGDEMGIEQPHEYTSSVNGKITRKYTRPSAATVLMNYAVMLDEQMGDVPTLKESLPLLTLPAYECGEISDVTPGVPQRHALRTEVHHDINLITPPDGVVGRIIEPSPILGPANFRSKKTASGEAV